MRRLGVLITVADPAHELQDELQGAVQAQELPGAGGEAAPDLALAALNEALVHLVLQHGLQRGVVMALRRPPPRLDRLHLRLDVPGHEAEEASSQAEEPARIISRHGSQQSVS